MRPHESPGSWLWHWGLRLRAPPPGLIRWRNAACRPGRCTKRARSASSSRTARPEAVALSLALGALIATGGLGGAAFVGQLIQGVTERRTPLTGLPAYRWHSCDRRCRGAFRSYLFTVAVSASWRVSWPALRGGDPPRHCVLRSADRRADQPPASDTTVLQNAVTVNLSMALR